VGVLVPIYLGWVALTAGIQQLASGLDALGRLIVRAMRELALAARRFLVAALRPLRIVLEAISRLVTRAARALEPLWRAARELTRLVGRGLRSIYRVVLRGARLIDLALDRTLAVALSAVGRIARQLGRLLEWTWNAIAPAARAIGRALARGWDAIAAVAAAFARVIERAWRSFAPLWAAIARAMRKVRALAAAVARVVGIVVQDISTGLRTLGVRLAVAARVVARVAWTQLRPMLRAIDAAGRRAIAEGRQVAAAIRAAIRRSLEPVQRTVAAARAALNAMLLPVREAFANAATATREAMRETRRGIRIRLGLPPDPSPEPRGTAYRTRRGAHPQPTAHNRKPSVVAAIAVVSAIVVITVTLVGTRLGLDDDGTAIPLILGGSVLAGLAAPPAGFAEGLAGFAIGMGLVVAVGAATDSAAGAGTGDLFRGWLGLTILGGVAFLAVRALRGPQHPSPSRSSREMAHRSPR
jgi:hypothetical protein